MMNTTRDYLRNLNANDRFCMPGSDTIYVCESRQSANGRTFVIYRVEGTDTRASFVRPGLTTIDRVI